MLSFECFVLRFTFSKQQQQQQHHQQQQQQPEVLVKTTSRRIGSSDEDAGDVTLRGKSAPGAGPEAGPGSSGAGSVSPAFTRPYTYESNIDEDNTKRKFEPYGVGFRYDGRSSEQSQPATSPTGKSALQLTVDWSLVKR